MKSRWLEHKGKRVFIADYSGYGDDSEAVETEALLVLNELTKAPGHSSLVIVDLHDTHASMATAAVFRKLLAQSHSLVRKRAVVGLSVSTRYFINTLVHLSGKGSLHPLDSIEEALEWIVKEE